MLIFLSCHITPCRKSWLFSWVKHITFLNLDLFFIVLVVCLFWIDKLKFDFCQTKFESKLSKQYYLWFFSLFIKKCLVIEYNQLRFHSIYTKNQYTFKVVSIGSFLFLFHAFSYSEVHCFSNPSPLPFCRS